MTSYVIVGAGAAGLYTAWRLLSGGTLASGDTVQIYEWSDRPGGRIYTYTFPAGVYPSGTQPDRLYSEFGGMRFAVDQGFKKNKKIIEGHVLVQSTIRALNLEDKVVDFDESPQRLYYLRGRHVYENSLDSLWAFQALPYGFNDDFMKFVQANIQPPYTADNLLGAIAALFAPNLGSSNGDRSKWCSYYASGAVTTPAAGVAFPAGTPIRDIGYWNLLYDQFGDEGFDYSADGTGYTSNVINWNAADAMQANNDYGSSTSYMRLDGGYSILFETLASKVKKLAAKFPGSGLLFGEQLTSLSEAANNRTLCTFSKEGQSHEVLADQLFLAMPRRSLELVAAGCSQDYMLNQPAVRYWLDSSIDQPAIKVVMVFDEAWWTSAECAFPPQLFVPKGAPESQGVGGPSITDLPLRMVYYFGNNVPGGPGTKGGPYVLLASYDDMNYSGFWRELEISGDYPVPPPVVRQPLDGPTEVPADSPLTAILLKQLAELHGIALDRIPAPTGVYFQDWGQDPFGAGYHGWSAHYNICQAMDYVRAPYARILGNPDRRTYIIGSCYSFDQAWVEGAFCVAESVLQDFVELKPFVDTDYKLICTATMGEGGPPEATLKATPADRKATHPSRAHRG
ncbi:MAG: hypothetical protein QOE79_1967 [Sphingomonadales bacterium]|jgi:hypothetical protein|nr:hypothetical protein [Sphingomonadales bacterium]